MCLGATVRKFAAPATDDGPGATKVILAPAIEQRFTNEQILELHLNCIYPGGSAHVVDTAARRFFGHSADQLTSP